jgi:hypothetical protein
MKKKGSYQPPFNAIKEAVTTDQVGDQVTRILRALSDGELGSSELMTALGLSHRPTFRKNYLDPALEAGWIERTHPESPQPDAALSPDRQRKGLVEKTE